MNQRDNEYPCWWLLAIVIVMLTFVTVVFPLIFTSKAHGHDIHFEEMVHAQCPVVAQGWVYEVGFVFATDCDGDDGIPDAFWLLYKDGDLNHMGLHIKPLTNDTAKWMLTVGAERPEEDEEDTDNGN